MRKIFKNLSKILCLILAMVTSFTFIGCNNGGSDETIYKDTYTFVDTETYPENNPDLIYDGVHDFTAPELDDKWLIKGGKTDYTVVFPASTVEANDLYYRYYMNEFVYFWQKATGFVPKVITDAELPVKTHQADTKYISVGKTTLVKSTNIDYSMESLTRVGGRVKLVDNNVYIIGFCDTAILSAVYSFFQVTFNYQIYSANTFEIDENVTDLKLRDYNVTDIPDILYMPTSSYERASFALNYDYSRSYEHATYDAVMYGMRIRAFRQGDIIIREIAPGYKPEDLDTDTTFWERLGTTSGHNAVEIVRFSKYGESHPAWFSDSGVQLCWSTHGNDAEFELLTTLIADAACMAFKMYPTEKYPMISDIQITNFDSPIACECWKCKELRANGYTDSGIITRFLNVVCEKVEDWITKPENAAYYRPDWTVWQAAYLNTMAPSATYDVAEEAWVPNHPDVVLHEHSAVEFCPGATDYGQSLFASDNKWVVDYMDAWHVLAHGEISYFHYLNYTRIPNYFLDYFDFVETKSWNYQIFGAGNHYMYSESIHGAAATEWGALLSFLTGMLSYNSVLDSGKLIKNWFNAQFGAASNIMYTNLQNLRMHIHNQKILHDDYKRSSNDTAVNVVYDWDKAIIASWINDCDRAEEAVAYLKDIDPDEYERICYNIALERHSYIYIMFDRFKSNLNQTEYSDYKGRIVSALDRWAEYEYTQSGMARTTLQWLATL